MCSNGFTRLLAASAALVSATLVHGQSVPDGCVGSGIGIDLVPFVDGAPTTAPVSAGDEIFYQVSLSQPLSFACSYHLGQLSVTLPDGTVVPAAGYEGTPDVPLVGYDTGSFTVLLTTAYVVDEKDLNADGVLVASADYGSTVTQPDQSNGTVLSSPPTPANSASIASPLQFADPVDCLLGVTLTGCLAQSPVGDACDGKLLALTLTYTGEACTATEHGQDPAKVRCEDHASLTELVHVRVSDKENPNNGSARIWFEGAVALGDSFVASAENAGSNHFRSATYVHVIDEAGDVIQFVEFHTSCSEPLAPGHQFGGFRIDSMTTTQGGVVGPDTSGCITQLESDGPVAATYTYTVANLGESTITAIDVIDDVFGPVPGSPIGELAPGQAIDLTLVTDIDETTTNTVTVSPLDAAACAVTADATLTVLSPPGGCCETGNKPRIIFMHYTADGCAGSFHDQSSSSVECDDAGVLPEVARIRASDSGDPHDGAARIWFDADVALGQTFAIDAAFAGESMLRPTTFIHVLDDDGTPLQSVEFHTSCSQPLREGDQFGASRILECIGHSEPLTDCDGNGIEDAVDLLASDADCNGNGVVDACDADDDGDGIPNDCEGEACASDLTGDGIVDVMDLVTVFLAWKTADTEADIDGDGAVGVSDMTEVIKHWGPCP